MKVIKREGKSEFEVVTSFMKEFKVKREAFDYKVIEQGSKGFFSLFGAKPTIIEFSMGRSCKKGVQDNGVVDFLTDILNLMDVKFSKMDVRKKGKYLNVNICGVEEKGFLIGREGKLLDSLQLIAYRMTQNKGEEGSHILLDIDGYRYKKEKSLINKVKSFAQKVKEKGTSFTMDPMTATDRKLVHQFVEKDKELKTMTIGEGKKKRIVIMLASSDEKPVERQYRRRKFKPRPRRTEERAG